MLLHEQLCGLLGQLTSAANGGVLLPVIKSRLSLTLFGVLLLRYVDCTCSGESRAVGAAGRGIHAPGDRLSAAV